MSLVTLGYAFLGGFFPALIWLYFLLREESRCPEPGELIALAFVAGMLAVPAALPLERLTCAQFFCTATNPNPQTIIAWATIEETLKYIAAALFILWRHAINKSPDYVVYMLTVALGFAAVENALFLLTPLSGGNIASTVITSDLRFIGSTLLHVLASSSIGFALAFSFHRPPAQRILFATGGVILAITLHVAFNALILQAGGSDTLAAFFLVWTTMVAFFAAFEVLKYFEYRGKPKNTC